MQGMLRLGNRDHCSGCSLLIDPALHTGHRDPDSADSGGNADM